MLACVVLVQSANPALSKDPKIATSKDPKDRIDFQESIRLVFLQETNSSLFLALERAKRPQQPLIHGASFGSVANFLRLT